MRGGGKDALYTAVATIGLALATLGFVADGSLAWVLRLGGLALTGATACGLMISVLRQRSK